jgi:hypothetical protein
MSCGRWDRPSSVCQKTNKLLCSSLDPLAHARSVLHSMPFYGSSGREPPWVSPTAALEAPDDEKFKEQAIELAPRSCRRRLTSWIPRRRLHPDHQQGVVAHYKAVIRHGRHGKVPGLEGRKKDLQPWCQRVRDLRRRSAPLPQSPSSSSAAW